MINCNPDKNLQILRFQLSLHAPQVLLAVNEQTQRLRELPLREVNAADVEAPHALVKPLQEVILLVSGEVRVQLFQLHDLLINLEEKLL